MSCRKRKFTALDAKIALARIEHKRTRLRRLGRYTERRAESRAYWCPECGWHHLTSETERTTDA